MKKRNLVIATLFVFLSAGLFAQTGGDNPKNNKKGGMLMNIPNLTDTQKDEIKKMRTAHMKEIKPIKDKIREKNAHLQTLQTSDKPDMNEIYKEIEETGSLRTEMAKKQAKFRQEIRKILTDEQRIYFDTHYGKHHKKKMKHGNMQ